jgi:SOS-response transcriptional repressor LexA
MTALAERTIEVMPLGRRGRFSLTPQLQRAYLFIVRHLDTTGWMPTHNELADAGFASKGGARTDEIFRLLEERGWIERRPYRARGIALTEPVLRDLKPVGDA